MSAVLAFAASFDAQFTSAKHLLRLERDSQRLHSGCLSLDTLFRLGIVPGTFLEIFGQSSTGKSQLCMQLVLNQQLASQKGHSIYVDTEGGFVTSRVRELAAYRLPKLSMSDVLDSIHHCRCRDLVELLSCINRLESMILADPKIGLIVIDSIAMPLRYEFEYLRASILDLSRTLLHLAADYRCTVIAVNHVTSRLEDSAPASIKSTLGTAWSHYPCESLWLSHSTSDTSQYKSACLIKSPSNPYRTVNYRITVKAKYKIMKFLAVLVDQGATDSFAKIAEAVSRLCKDRVILRITPDSIAFINSDFLRSNGTFLQIRLSALEFFSSYILSGVSEENNEIFMEIDKDYLYRSINVREQTTKIRLTKVGVTPYLRLEQKTCAVVHEIPAELIPVRQWKLFDSPCMDGVKAAIYFPPVSTVRNLICSIKNIGVKYLMVKANQRGDLHFNGDVETAQIDVYFNDLVVNRDVAIDGEENNSNVLHEVRVDIKTIYSLLRSISSNLTFSRIQLRVVPDKMIILSIDQSDIALTYYISGLLV